MLAWETVSPISLFFADSALTISANYAYSVCSVAASVLPTTATDAMTRRGGDKRLTATMLETHTPTDTYTHIHT